jgi:hypothetical protein
VEYCLRPARRPILKTARRPKAFLGRFVLHPTGLARRSLSLVTMGNTEQAIARHWAREGEYVKRIAPPATIISLCALVIGIASAHGQDAPKGKAKKSEAAAKVNPAIDNELEVRYGAEHVTTQRLGVRIKAIAGPVKDVYGTLQIATNWPEQTIRITKEEISPAVRTSKYRETGLLKQFMFHMPFVETAKEEFVEFHLEYVRKEVLQPEDTSTFKIPKKLDKELRIFLGDSPKLDPKTGKVSQTLKEIGAGFTESTTDWEKVEAIFLWVKENISRHMTTGATTAEILKNKKANTEDIVATFVAMCRAARVPARMVWLTEGVSAEFYLQDESGAGRWFPCSYGAKSEFGFSTESRPIVLKGDSFRVPADVFQVPEQKGEQRSIVESLKCSPGGPGAGKPQVDFVRVLTSSPATPPAAAGTKGGMSMESKPGEKFIPIPGASVPGTSPPTTTVPATPLPPTGSAAGQSASKSSAPGSAPKEPR